ncbi:MAG: hypothetical protein ACO3CR_08235 [Solirubrobacterales bacterium]
MIYELIGRLAVWTVRKRLVRPNPPPSRLSVLGLGLIGALVGLVVVGVLVGRTGEDEGPG